MPAPFLRLAVLSWAVVGFATETSAGLLALKSRLEIWLLTSVSKTDGVNCNSCNSKMVHAGGFT